MFNESTILDRKVIVRREIVFLVLTGLFLGSLTMLNILGISRFISIPIELTDNFTIPLTLAVGVLPYPITFLCTDLISELYGRARANRIVWIGFILNLWVLLVLWIGGALDVPELGVDGIPPLSLSENGEIIEPHGRVFYQIRTLTFGATFASMIAYLAAQFIDVRIFHFLKSKTKGKKLWLRNNASTLISQLVDSVAVILITHYYANALPPVPEESTLTNHLIVLILSGYLFKVLIALLDTVPMYIAVRYLSVYLHLNENEEVL